MTSHLLALLLGASLAACSSSDTTSGTGAGADAGTAEAGAADGSMPGSPAPSVACDTTLFPQAPPDAVRTPTAAELARYTRKYDGQVYFNASGTSTPGPAELRADGKLVMVGTTYDPTSYCYETIVGAPETGNTLYVHFAGGHADLWERNGTYSGSVDK